MVIRYLLHHFTRGASGQIMKISDQMHLVVITVSWAIANQFPSPA